MIANPDSTVMSQIRESVDSRCRDSTDMQFMQFLSMSCINFTTDALKDYLSAQASSLSAFVIRKSYISGQKPVRRQVNAKVCGSKSVW